MDSGSDSVWAKNIDDVSEHSDIDDNLCCVYMGGR